MISYEYPLNERVRTLLRLEDLFTRARFFATKENAQDHHVALLTLFEILEVAGRADLKSDLIQELERQKQAMESLRHNPAISQDALNDILKDISVTLASLYELSGKIGQQMRDIDWLTGIKQRTKIPGGVCEFDVPAFHFWLSRHANLRQQDLFEWLTPMFPIYDGLRIVLRLLRDSGKSSNLVAAQGMFQQVLSGKVAQLVKIDLDNDLPCFPEISANRYALNIRFTSLSNASRSRFCDADVPFDLTLCSF